MQGGLGQRSIQLGALALGLHNGLDVALHLAQDALDQPLGKTAGCQGKTLLIRLPAFTSL